MSAVVAIIASFVVFVLSAKYSDALNPFFNNKIEFKLDGQTIGNVLIFVFTLPITFAAALIARARCRAFEG